MFTRLIYKGGPLVLLLGLVVLALLTCQPVQARSAATPWTMEQSLANLVYGATTGPDLQQIMGRPPDEIERLEQMHPVMENWYYYEDGGTGAATVFVFQANLLVGMLVKTASNQFIDLTYMLPNNNDMQLNAPILGGFRGYYPSLPFYTW